MTHLEGNRADSLIRHLSSSDALSSSDRLDASTPLMLTLAITVFEVLDPAELGAERVVSKAMILHKGVDCMLTRIDRLERAVPLDMNALTKQRQLVKVLAVHAHCNSTRILTEVDVLSLSETTPALQEGWAMLRRKLARGSLPLFSILQQHPLQFQFAHLSIQEFLTADAISNGSCPQSLPAPWAWGEWWASVAAFGAQGDVRAFGGALLKHFKVDEIVLDQVSGGTDATASAVVAMVQSREAEGSRLPLRVGTARDVLERVRSNEGRACELELGGLSAVGVSVFCRLLTALSEEGSSTGAPQVVDLSKNGLTVDHAAVIVSSLEAAKRPITRLSLDRNRLGDAGAAAFCESFSGNTTLIDVDLSNNELGVGAAEAIGGLLRKASISRLVLTSNPLCGVNWQGVGEYNTAGFKSFCEALGPCNTLKELQLRANGLCASAGKLLGDAMSANRTLESLSLWKNALGTDGARALLTALRTTSALTLIDLRDNKLDDEAGAPLAQLIGKKLKVASLLLSDNSLGPISGTAIGKAWISAPDVLAVVDIRANRLDKDAAKTLRSAHNGAVKKRLGKQGLMKAELLIDDALL